MKTDKEPRVTAALTKCFYCQGDSGLIMLKSLLPTKKQEEEIKAMHNHIINMEPCSKCVDLMKQGVILITIDPSKSDEGWERAPMPNPFRTGAMFVVNEEGLRRMVTDTTTLEWALKHRWIFIDDEAARKSGLYDAAVEQGHIINKDRLPNELGLS